ncbi:MAG TPA: apolipoprotein N-acyltransferase [Streptosporangiaceae bacterium]
MAVLRALTRPVRYLSLVAGALPVLAFPAANLEFVAWFGLVPGLLLIRAAPGRREAAVRGWWLGTGFLLAGMYWLAPSIGPGLLLVAVVLGALWTGVAVSTWTLLRSPLNLPRALAALVVVPSFWLVLEWIRSWQALGGPWNVLGASQWQHPAILALAAVGGVWLVSFAIVAANVGIVIVLVSGRLGLRALGALATAVVIAAGPVAFALTPAAPAVRQVTLALVQPGVKRNPASRINDSLALSAALAPPTGNTQPDSGPPGSTASRAGRAGLIVWGESSVYYLQPGGPLLRHIEALAASTGAEILVNQDSVHDGKKTKVAVLVGPHGITGEYVKTRLVPFGEYIPFRQQLSWLTSISRAAPVNMTPGTGAHVLQATIPGQRPLTIGVLICFESAFPDMSRVDTDHGAQVIIYQTSDVTFQDTWALAQHASLGALRAAETGRPVVQAALTGDSAAFDSRGRLLSWFGSSRDGVDLVHLSLPAASVRTPYDRFGDYVPWTAVVIAAIACGVALLRRRGDWPGFPTRHRVRDGGEAIQGGPACGASTAAAGQPGTGD